jgi:hypothetical protein
MADFAVAVVACCQCQSPDGSGNWRLCPACRSALGERVRLAMARRPDRLCPGCGHRRRGASGYCAVCSRRFAQLGATR